jgi:hypothetical protein
MTGDESDMSQKMGSSPIYREVQRFRQVWVWVVVLVLAGLMWYATIMQIVLDTPFGGTPMPDIALVMFWFVFGLGLPALFLFGRLVTEVRDDGIYIRFFPFHWSYRRIAFTEMKQVIVREYRPIREYGGWGIRSGREGKAYNVSGDRGVQMELVNGERVLIGSQRAEELWRAIDRVLGSATCLVAEQHGGVVAYAALEYAFYEQGFVSIGPSGFDFDS